jgi:two-component system response regulator CiaR
MKVLVVEDDRHLLEAMVSVLEDENYEVDQADNGLEGLHYAEQGLYDLLLLDIMLPGLDGISIIHKLRRKGIVTPTLFLTASDSVESRVRGLDAGADDYMTKPFAIDELLARVRALLRRSKGYGAEGELSYGPFLLHPGDYEVFCNGETVKLTVKEFELLTYLLQNKEQILRRDQVFARVWGFDSDANETAVDLYVHYIRKKLQPFGGDQCIRTIRGVGYMLKAVEAHV